VLEDGRLVHARIVDTGTDPLARARELLDGRRADTVFATGYGRHLARTALGFPTITEIRAHALGASFLFPRVRTVVDVGGQDCKVIRVNRGTVEEFEMNDRCAAGTGKFFEVMARALNYSLEEFARVALGTHGGITVSSMCTVFAESEVISLIAGGESLPSIARSLHDAAITRLMGLISRVGVEPEVVFSGGVALNPCMVKLLSEKLGLPLRISDEPQLVGALGAALAAGQDATVASTGP
jgi:(R)-2-hydroxyacyl-CoA dehydratese activating ATPase